MRSAGRRVHRRYNRRVPRPPRLPYAPLGVLVLPALASGCAGRDAERLLAYVRGADGAYAVEGRAMPTLDDPVRMSGALGEVSHGGRFVGDPLAPTYSGGGPVDVRFVVRDGVAVPLDQDGLLLWSFWGHLEDARAAVEARGVDLGGVFPLPVAWNPAVSWTFELSPVDNAAYAVGSNFFVLLPDGDDRDVPLLANAGVVTHELGHATFHVLTRGDPTATPLVTDVGTEPALWQASMHEAFADGLATLLLDDAAFLDPSIAMPSRDVTASAVLTADLLPSAAVETLDESLGLYDPYPLGTVFASASWDVRVALDDPDAALDLLVRATEAWAPADEAEMDGLRFLEVWWEEAAAGAERDAVCGALRRRFAGFHEVDACL